MNTCFIVMGDHVELVAGCYEQIVFGYRVCTSDKVIIFHNIYTYIFFKLIYSSLALIMSIKCKCVLVYSSLRICFFLECNNFDIGPFLKLIIITGLL